MVVGAEYAPLKIPYDPTRATWAVSLAVFVTMSLVFYHSNIPLDPSSSLRSMAKSTKTVDNHADCSQYAITCTTYS